MQQCIKFKLVIKALIKEPDQVFLYSLNSPEHALKIDFFKADFYIIIKNWSFYAIHANKEVFFLGSGIITVFLLWRLRHETNSS